MEFFKANTAIDFMKQRKAAAIFSIIICLASVVIIFVNGLNLGLDFTGGTQIELGYEKSADITKIRHAIEEGGYEDAVVQPYGSSTEVLIRLAQKPGLNQDQLKANVQKLLPDATIRQVEYIGPQVGKTLVTNGILAILVSLLGTMLYMTIRFEYRFAVSAAVALIHDPVLTLGIFSLFHIEFNLIALASVLTVIGYSLNDTVVVYDRVRENFRLLRKGSVSEILNKSINQTLSRTIMTSTLTLIVVTALFVFGGEVLRGFSLALIIGIIIGTYSSIYVAGSLAVAMGLERKHLLPVAATEVDELP